MRVFGDEAVGGGCVQAAREAYRHEPDLSHVHGLRWCKPIPA